MSRSGSAPHAATARAWCRVDLAGGTLDIWPLGLLHPGAVTVNLAVDLPVRVTVERGEGYAVRQGDEEIGADTAEELARRPEGALVGTVLAAMEAPPVSVGVESGSPRGGGLGASSALAVALVAAVEAVDGRSPSEAASRVALARDVEARLMSLPTGIQDHWPALLGGALAIHHRPGGIAVEPLDVDLAALGDVLQVAYTGVSHFSAGQNWEVVRRRLDGESEVTELFSGIARVAAEARRALADGDLPRLGRLVGEEWSLRRRLAPGISVPAVEELLDAARAAGAWGGKACGAGGGGCVAVLAPPEARDGVARALEDAGGRLLELRPTATALSVEGVGSR